MKLYDAGRAALPDVFPEDALRHTRQANSLLRTLATGRRELERRQTARRKAQDTPSERGGYFVAKYESVAPGFVAPSPAPANRAAEPAQEPAPPQPEPAKAAPQATPRSVVTVGDIMQRFEARKIGPGETREQVWDQCTQEALDAARRAA